MAETNPRVLIVDDNTEYVNELTHYLVPGQLLKRKNIIRVVPNELNAETFSNLGTLDVIVLNARL